MAPLESEAPLEKQFCFAAGNMTMVITYSKSGGFAYFPGLAKGTTIDTTTLAPEQTAELERLVQESHFFELPPQIGTLHAGMADMEEQTVSIEEGGQRHTVRLTGLIEDQNLQSLVAKLQALQRAAR